jgi:hypothetical protein
MFTQKFVKGFLYSSFHVGVHTDSLVRLPRLTVVIGLRLVATKLPSCFGMLL